MWGCWQQWAHRSHHQQLNLSQGRCKIWMEATEAQRNTTSQRQSHKQRNCWRTKNRVRGRASSKVTAFVEVQSKLHKCQHLLFMTTKARMLSSLEIADVVNSCNVIEKKKFKFLSATACCQLKARKNISGSTFCLCRAGGPCQLIPNGLSCLCAVRRLQHPYPEKQQTFVRRAESAVYSLQKPMKNWEHIPAALEPQGWEKEKERNCCMSGRKTFVLASVFDEGTASYHSQSYWETEVLSSL